MKWIQKRGFAGIILIYKDEFPLCFFYLYTSASINVKFSSAWEGKKSTSNALFQGSINSECAFQKSAQSSSYPYKKNLDHRGWKIKKKDGNRECNRPSEK